MTGPWSYLQACAAVAPPRLGRPNRGADHIRATGVDRIADDDFLYSGASVPDRLSATKRRNASDRSEPAKTGLASRRASWSRIAGAAGAGLWTLTLQTGMLQHNRLRAIESRGHFSGGSRSPARLPSMPDS